MLPIPQRALVHMMEMQADGQRLRVSASAPETDRDHRRRLQHGRKRPFTGRFQLGGR